MRLDVLESRPMAAPRIHVDWTEDGGPYAGNIIEKTIPHVTPILEEWTVEETCGWAIDERHTYFRPGLQCLRLNFPSHGLSLLLHATDRYLRFLSGKQTARHWVRAVDRFVSASSEPVASLVDMKNDVTLALFEIGP